MSESVTVNRSIVEALVKTLEELAASEKQAAADTSSDWWRGLKEGKATAFALRLLGLREVGCAVGELMGRRSLALVLKGAA